MPLNVAVDAETNWHNARASWHCAFSSLKHTKEVDSVIKASQV